MLPVLGSVKFFLFVAFFGYEVYSLKKMLPVPGSVENYFVV